MTPMEIQDTLYPSTTDPLKNIMKLIDDRNLFDNRYIIINSIQILAGVATMFGGISLLHFNIPKALVGIGLIGCMLFGAGLAVWSVNNIGKSDIALKRKITKICDNNQQDLIYKFYEIANQIVPENYTLREAVSLIFRIMRICDYIPKRMFKDEFDAIFHTLLRYSEVQAYFLTKNAADYNVVHIAPETFARQTGKWLNEMEDILTISAITLNSQAYTDRLDELEQEFCQANTQNIKQLSFNLTQIYREKGAHEIELAEKERKEEEAVRKKEEQEYMKNYNAWRESLPEHLR